MKMAFINYKTCCNDSKQLIRLAVLVACVCVSLYQLTQCFRKINYPPISTHYGFYLNKSLRYPAVTICRNPPYKTEVFEKFGFTDNKEIEISSTWKSFKFMNKTLQEFFDETTYKFNEIIKIAAINKHIEDIQVTSSYALNFGLCFTVTPKFESKNWGSNYGYLFIFREMNPTKNSTHFKEDSFGFHVFIQDEVEKFTEKSQQADIFKEYIYVEAGDAVQVNIKMSRYNQLPSRTNDCNPECNYSKSRCVEDTINKLISEKIGCSTPWIPNANLSACNTYEQTQQMIEHSTPGIYLDRYLDQIKCPLRCNATTYTPFLQGIRQLASTKCFLKIYFSSNLYTQMEEIAGYDWNAFLSDLGGSLGFLLGLSVLGMIGLTEELIGVIIRVKNARKSKEDLSGKDCEIEEIKEIDAVSCKNNINQEYKMGLDLYSKECPKEKY